MCFPYKLEFLVLSRNKIGIPKTRVHTSGGENRIEAVVSDGFVISTAFRGKGDAKDNILNNPGDFK